MIGPMEKSSLLKFDCATRSGSFRQISLWIAQLYCSVTRNTLMPEDLQWFSQKHLWTTGRDGFDKSILVGKLGRSDQWQLSCKQHVTAQQTWSIRAMKRRTAKKKKGGKDGENIVRESRSIRAQNVGMIWVNASEVLPVHPVLIPIDCLWHVKTSHYTFNCLIAWHFYW